MNQECPLFDGIAAVILEDPHTQKIRVGTNNLANAAITLSVNGILVTRNAIDFQRVPRLVFEDWTK